ncbi:hypothetical protein RUM43_010656 [Polyplax serrata]|uniref:C2 NT-type domain-containing protein n=1 Tax=Polyplax serrata TaxID=468196 RepID=A0AAN8P7K9_POLSC
MVFLNVSEGIEKIHVVEIGCLELKGGRSFQKLGFSDLNLAEFAGAGYSVRKCLLEGYDTRHRQDNSMLKVAITMNMLSGDILFKVPSTTANQNQIASQEGKERREDFSSGSIASGSSGFGSLPKKRSPLFSSELVSGPQPSESFTESASEKPEPVLPDETHEPGHSRNSSNTSQMSRASGYSSLNSQSQHSRQSSSGDSGHIRSPSWPVWAPRLPPIPSTTAPPSPENSIVDSRIHFHSKLRVCNGFSSHNTSATTPLLKSVTNPSFPRLGNDETLVTLRLPPLTNPSKSLSSPGILHSPNISRRSCAATLIDSTVISRNASSGSGPSETGSLDRAKSAIERRKKSEENTVSSGGRVEVTRVNPNSLIDELLRSTDFTQAAESTESTGLQLFIAKDGTTALGSQDVVKSQMSGVFKQVVIEDNR